MASGAFHLFRYKGKKLITIDNVNSPKDYLKVRKLMDGWVSPAPQEAGGVGFDLNGLAPK